MGVTHTFVSGIADDPAAAAAGQVLPSHWNATHTVNVNLASEVSGVLPVVNGGSGTATPSLVAGTNITVSGTWPNQTINAAGGSPGGSTTQLQYNNAGAFGGASGLTTNGTELTIASGTKTADAPLLNATQTWNNAAVVFTGIKFNVINTASDVNNSALMDLQVGGTSQYKFKRNGNLEVANGVNCAAGNIQTAANFGLNNNGSGVYWRTAQTWLFSDANNALDQRNGTNAQAFRVYNTYTSSTSYERIGLTWTSNVAYLAPEKGSGGGTARLLVVNTGATTVAGLPSAATAGTGARSFVTDATATTYLSTVAGGGANKVPVVSDGTNWLIG